MAIKTKASIASKFETGDKPTESEFLDLIDTFVPISTGGATGVMEVLSTASTTAINVGTVGVRVFNADTTASARAPLGLIAAASGGTVGQQLFDADTTASAQGHLGIEQIGTIIIESDTTASVQTQVGGGTVGIRVLESVTTASTRTITQGPLFISSDTSVDNTTTTNIAHGLGAVPSLFAVVLKNVSAQHGYSPNDETTPWLFEGTGGNPAAVSIGADATNIFIVTSQDIAVVTKTTGPSVASITLGNWRWVARAWP